MTFTVDLQQIVNWALIIAFAPVVIYMAAMFISIVVTVLTTSWSWLIESTLFIAMGIVNVFRKK